MKTKKQLYDFEYRKKNKEKLKVKKRAYYLANKDKYKELGRARRQTEAYKASHRKACNRPNYVARKRLYDKVYQAIEKVGEFYECHLILVQLDKLITKKIPKKERLHYLKNVKVMNKRNKVKRIEKAVNDYEKGDISTRDLLCRAWTFETRLELESIVFKGEINDNTTRH